MSMGTIRMRCAGRMGCRLYRRLNRSIYLPSRYHPHFLPNRCGVEVPSLCRGMCVFVHAHMHAHTSALLVQHAQFHVSSVSMKDEDQALMTIQDETRQCMHELDTLASERCLTALCQAIAPQPLHCTDPTETVAVGGVAEMASSSWHALARLARWMGH